MSVVADAAVWVPATGIVIGAAAGVGTEVGACACACATLTGRPAGIVAIFDILFASFFLLFFPPNEKVFERRFRRLLDDFVLLFFLRIWTGAAMACAISSCSLSIKFCWSSTKTEFREYANSSRIASWARVCYCIGMQTITANTIEC